MGRSLYVMLNDYFSPRPSEREWRTGMERKLQLSRAAWTNVRSADCKAKLKTTKVAIVGGGFAGLSAAWFLADQEVNVTLFEAREEVGGRVKTSDTITPNRLIEAGAEFIGAIHPLWIQLAENLKLDLKERSTDACYAAVGLEVQLWIDGELIPPDEARELKAALEQRILKPISRDAKAVKNPAQPWNESPTIKEYDKSSVADKLVKLIGPKPIKKVKETKKERQTRLLWRLMEIWFGTDHVSPIEDFSYLALLCLVKGGQLGDDKTDPDLMGYWEHLETYRCAQGNQSLASRMAKKLKEKPHCRIHTSTPVEAIEIHKATVELTTKLSKETFDYVVLAIPPNLAMKIKPDPKLGSMNTGKAAKIFSNVKRRFWLNNEVAPSAHSSTMGQVWEATDAQTPPRKPGVNLAVFAGGSIPDDKTVERGLTQLYKEPYKKNLIGSRIRWDWSEKAYIKTGYAAPKKGQVLTIGERLNRPFEDRLFYAGEHVAMDSFGYMEGALQSGRRAAQAIMQDACRRARSPRAESSVRTAELSERTSLERELAALRLERRRGH
jgi:monoamine oxidase